MKEALALLVIFISVKIWGLLINHLLR
jgi:hypothetical protein